MSKSQLKRLEATRDAALAAVGDILEMVMTYEGKQRRVVPGSIWYGAKDFKTAQRWWLTAKDKDLGRVVEFKLSECRFERASVEPVETSRITPAQAQEVPSDVDPRQQLLPDIVEDTVVGNGPGPNQTKLL